ncbi:restriction endonuclease subunit S [Lactiplantibacillus plantarum]|nr:restriction endonuclease subunit S [Lactiplantibacillus plantarum]
MAKIDDSVKKKVPELRFKGFTDEWEERKLKDIAQFNPKTVLPDEFEYVDLESVVGTEMISHRTESKDQAPSRAQRLAQKGDVFYQTVRPYQMNNYLYDLPYDNYVFSTGYAQMRPNIDSYFLLNSVQNKQFVQHVLDRSTGTSYPAINSSDLSNIEIHVPSKLSEQQKIGAFFQSIDDTIAANQRKLDLLKEQKKGYLQKMFPKNGAKVPELRFAGFADAWEEHKLGEMLINLEAGVSVNSSDYETGYFILKTSAIKQGTVDSFEVKSVVQEEVCKAKTPLIKNSIIISRMNTPELVGASGLVRESIDNIFLPDRLWQGQVAENFSSEWLIQSINIVSNIQKIRNLATGTSGSMKNISKKSILDLIINVPKLKEQKQIGSFLKQLDNTIALHQRKLDLLKEQKKGFLQKMFV